LVGKVLRYSIVVLTLGLPWLLALLLGLFRRPAVVPTPAVPVSSNGQAGHDGHLSVNGSTHGALESVNTRLVNTNGNRTVTGNGDVVADGDSARVMHN